MRDIDFDFSDILLDEKSCKTCNNLLIYDILYKTFTSSIPLHIRFNKIDGFIKICDRIRYLVLFNHGWCDKISDRNRYLISERSCIIDSINHNFGRITIDSYNSLPIENILTFHKVIILVKSVINNNENNYYYNIFLEKS